MTRFDFDAEAAGLCAFIDAAPSPFHACAEAAVSLEEISFARVEEVDTWSREPGRYYTIRGGSLIAWTTEYAGGNATPFRVVAAHTDSPNLRIKPRPDLSRAGWQLLGVEVYGGPLLNSWLDRDLGLSGRVAVESGTTVTEQLILINDPILRVTQLAVHLDRGVNDKGLKLNPQDHLAPIWGVGTEPGDFKAMLAATVKCDAEDILGWDLMTHDLTPSRRIGQDGALIAAARLDNLGTCYAGVRALVTAVEATPATPQVPVLVLFDHEENGSVSERGASSTLLSAVLERIVATLGGGREEYLRALAGTVIASGDMVHATHPNYAEYHEPQHLIAVNQGPVLKISNRLRYATDALGSAAFARACAQADVPFQQFVNRANIPSGSTVGPIIAALTGATTVDFGAAISTASGSRMDAPALASAALTPLSRS